MHIQPISNVSSRFVQTGKTNAPSLMDQLHSQASSVGSMQTKSAGETLFAEGDAAEKIYEVVRGTVRLIKLLPDGRRQIIGFVSAGELLGLTAGSRFDCTAEAVDDVTLRRYERATFDRMIDSVPGFARHVLAITSRNLGVAQDQMVLLGRKSAAEKVASFLLLIADNSGDESDTINIPMSRTDIADFLGVTIETVCRALSRLKADGLIALPNSARIELIDRDGLEELAAGEIEHDC